MVAKRIKVTIVEGEYLLERFKGKGGWTYILLPEMKPDKANPFGWVTIKGEIDDYKLNQVKLMPFGNGKLFLPVKAAIRKMINKKAGDTVYLKLSIDNSLVEIPNDILACFKEEPKQILKTFLSFTQGNQKTYLDWIAGAKTETTRANRIVQMMENLSMGLTLGEKP